MSSPPLVSVVVPSWERLPWLREAVGSVLRQTYRSLELIVVDDGSGDGSCDWVRGLDDPRVTLVALPHSGNLGLLRNRGIREARGELIAFLDSDDLFEPDKLETQVAALTARPGYGWSYTAMSRIDEGGGPLPPGVRWREISGWILEPLLRFEAVVDTPTVLVRRELLERVGGLDESLPECQDYDLFFRFAAASQAVMVPEPLTRKRIHVGATSADRTRVNEAWITVYERFGARSGDPAIKRTCVRQARLHRLAAATCRARGGDPARAILHVLAVLPARPWMLRAWRVLVADVLVRGFLAPLGRWAKRLPRSRTAPGPSSPGELG